MLHKGTQGISRSHVVQGNTGYLKIIKDWAHSSLEIDKNCPLQWQLGSWDLYIYLGFGR